VPFYALDGIKKYFLGGLENSEFIWHTSFVSESNHNKEARNDSESY
jgi:hypothetical protein